MNSNITLEPKKLIKLKNFLDKTHLICYNIYVTNK